MPIEETERTRKYFKYFIIALLYFGLAGCLWTFGMWNYQLDTLPRPPNPARGSIYPRNIHGVIVYQTLSERDRLERIQRAAIGVYGLGLLLSLLHRKIWGPEPNLNPPKIGTGWRPK
jgi:hypothetical protein